MMTIRKQLTVEAPGERAFRVFTANMGAWWPKQHHIGKATLKDCVEPKVNGRWYELGEDGPRANGARCWCGAAARLVLACMGSDWHDPALVTEVEDLHRAGTADAASTRRTATSNASAKRRSTCAT
jgi:hypothetical protein